MRILIFLALLFLAAVVAVRAGRYWAQNMDTHGRLALALLLAPAPQFLLTAILFAFAPTSHGPLFVIAAFFVLSYGMMLLVYVPVHMVLTLIGDRTHRQYTVAFITVPVVAIAALFFFLMPASPYPEPNVRFGYFLLASALVIPGAAVASSILWEIVVKPHEQLPYRSDEKDVGLLS